jgi:nucleotide-binding universal stress UspA family protein
MTAPIAPPKPDLVNFGCKLFSRIVVGVDGSEPGFEACRQAARLAAPDGWLELFTAVYLVEANLAGWSASRVAMELELEAGEALERAKEIAGPYAASRLVNGPAFHSLLRELEHRKATLVAVGTHGHSRISEIAIGGVTGGMLHSAPCSVLVARPPAAEALFPNAIVAGSDGSPEAEAGLAVAEHLAQRFGAPLRVVTAVRGKHVDVERARLRAPLLETIDEHPVDTLVEESRNADLLVVGSRGLHGLRALGSVSERVAHRARCSVLVVRTMAS